MSNSTEKRRAFRESIWPTIAGVGKTVVYDIENGKETVRLKTLFNVLGVLNISLSLESPLMDRYKAGDDAQG